MFAFNIPLFSLLIAVTSPSSFASAATDCANLFAPEAQRIHIGSDDSPGASKSMIAQLVIAEINSFLGSLLAPPQINLELKSGLPNHFNYPSLTIRVGSETHGIQLNARGGFFPVLAHEYAHQIFYRNFITRAMATFGPEINAKKLEKLRLNENDLTLTAESLRKTWIDRRLGQLQAEESRKPVPQRRPDYLLRGLAKEELKETDLFYFYYGLSGTPYNELFADTVAVLQSSQPSAMAAEYCSDFTLTKVESKYRDALLAQRNSLDFSATNSLMGWNQAEVHFQLGPTRSFLGREIIASNRHDRTQIVEAVFQAILTEIIARYLDPQLDHALRNSPEETNRRLIAAIQAAFNMRTEHHHR